MAQLIGRPPQPLSKRFWPKVEKRGVDQCWLWTGHVVEQGYGVIHRHGSKTSLIRSHRAAWELTYGPIPAGMLVCHKCDVRRCCNPRHLFLGTHKDNTQDMMTKGRGPTGEKQGRSKLTWDQVSTIRQRIAAGEQQTQIAKELGVSKAAISLIKLGTNWKEAHHGA